MQYQEYAKFVQEMKAKDFSPPEQDGLHGFIGLTSEVGELADLYKKSMWRGRGISRDEIIDEVGDVIYYVELLLSSVGSSLPEAMEKNFLKLSFRKIHGKNKEAEQEHVQMTYA